MSVRWHELELVVTIARAGSATAAAAELGTSQSTVSRKLAALEERLGVLLFDRQAHRLLPTTEGAELASAAGSLEGSVQSVVRRISGRDGRPDGRVRVTGIAPLLRAAMPAFATLTRVHPALELELDSSFVTRNLARGEADIAVRISPAPPASLIGRKLARFAYAMYQPAAVDAAPPGVIGYPPPRGDIATRPWLARVVADPTIRVRIDWDELHLDAVRNGMGVAQAPCFIGDADPQLTRVPGAPLEWGDWLWVLTHESLQHVARVRVVLDALVEHFLALASVFEGETSAATAQVAHVRAARR